MIPLSWRRCAPAWALVALAIPMAALGAPQDTETPAETIGWDELCLRRAVASWTAGDVPAALDALSARDTTVQLDRADFLARYGARITRHRELQTTLRTNSPWAPWALSLEHLDQGDVRSSLSLTSPELSDIWRDALNIHDLERTGANPSEALRSLARRSARHNPERELIAGAWWRLGVDVAGTGGDPHDLFARIPSGSSREASALLIEGLSARTSETSHGLDLIRRAQEGSLDPSEQRAAQHALAIQDLRHGEWEDAHRRLASAEASWREELLQLETVLQSNASLEGLWDEWAAPSRGSLVVNAAAFEAETAHRITQALDLHNNRPSPGTVPFPLGIAEPNATPIVARPETGDRDFVLQLAGEHADARADVVRSRRAVELESTGMARQGRYLVEGAGLVAEELAVTDSLLIHIDELLARTGAIVATLDAVRDQELIRIGQRTTAFLETARRQRVVVLALRHFHAAAPTTDRTLLPAGVPGPEEVLSAETGLGDDLQRWFDTFASYASDLTRRSHADVWVPRATDGTVALAANAAARRRHELTLAAAIDSSHTEATHPDRLIPARRHLLAAETRAEQAESTWHLERQRIARERVTQHREKLLADGEALLYAAAVAINEHSVAQLAAATTNSERDAARVLLENSGQRWEAFLAEYPNAPAHSEARYRLADVRLHEARETFRVAMQDFLGNEGNAPARGANDRTLAPFVDYAPALDLYRSLLVDDPGFAHRDAVLFHVGMILSDAAHPEASRHLTALVRNFPESRYSQEAHLRLADDLFASKDFVGCEDDYEMAAAGANSDHAAIALYKLGWAHYNRDQFDHSARSFRRLLDLYAAHPEAARATDLRDEANDHLVHALARAGGAPAFARLFDDAGGRPYERDTLTDLGRVLRRFSLFDEAGAADSLWLDRYPRHPDALAAGQRLVEQRGNETRLALADRFREGSEWSRAIDSDSLRAAGDEWAMESIRKVALFHHRAARQNETGADAMHDWGRALNLYEKQLHGWPGHASAPHAHFYAGEAAAALGKPRVAVRHFEVAAASDTASFRADAAWQGVTVRDAWYERERLAAVTPSVVGPDSLARDLMVSIDRFAENHGPDDRCADLLWRKGNVARSHEWRGEAADAFERLVRDWPGDERRPVAARLRSEALYATAEATPTESWFPQAAEAFDLAARLARESGDDSTATTLDTMVPHCHEREAGRVATAHDGDHRDSAKLFERLADQWPNYEHAHRALYRAGLGYNADGDIPDAVRAWTGLSQRYPESEYTRDAQLNVARAWERSDRPAAAARAYRDFAAEFPADADASAALMQAAGLFLASGDVVQSEATKTAYLKSYPEDVETTVEILEERAARELASVGPGDPVSSLLALAGSAAEGPSHLARYIELTNGRPELAAPKLLAQVRFLRGEEARTTYERSSITLPLGPSIAQKKSLLENVLQEYQNAAAYEVAPWNRASAVRIGECLVAFGDALMESERPADLTEDDLYAYDEVLEEQSFEFFDRGEEAWTALVQQSDAVASQKVDDPWVEAARQQLWPRIATRFLHRPEVDYPLIEADDQQPDEAP